MMINNKPGKVFVAMSGGVDSSVVAALMKEQGHDVVGVTMCFSITHPENRKPSCCGVDGIQDARRAAQILGIPHYVLDFARDIREFVIDDFVEEYMAGRTPNPCVRCNQYLKFRALYEKVKALGADYLATGHYAKIVYDEARRRYVMKAADDARKDQSYFLYSVDKELLPSVLFPLGDMTKGEVRALAEKYKLNTARKPESQDICFVPEGGYKKFIEDRAGKEAFVPGPFVNHEGKVVGEHQGIARYTIGQREGLGIALGMPVYVYRIEKASNTVFVGPQNCLYAQGLTAGRVNSLSMDLERVEKPGPRAHKTIDVSMRIRYNAPEIRGKLTSAEKGRIEVIFEAPQKSVTPGQSVVFYDGDVVLGGAVIEEKIPLEHTNVQAVSPT